MATLWVVVDGFDSSWATAAIRRKGHAVKRMNVRAAQAQRRSGLRPDLVLVSLAAEGALDLVDEFEPTTMLFLGKEGDLLDGALAQIYTAGAPCIPDAPGHELELIGAVTLQLERAGVDDG